MKLKKGRQRTILVSTAYKGTNVTHFTASKTGKPRIRTIARRNFSRQRDAVSYAKMLHKKKGGRYKDARV